MSSSTVLPPTRFLYFKSFFRAPVFRDTLKKKKKYNVERIIKFQSVTENVLKNVNNRGSRLFALH